MLVMGYDGKMVTANIPKLMDAIDQGANKGSLDAAFELMRLSQIEVPHDEGTLQNSGTVEVDNSTGDVTMGYHTPYAARLHEHPEYRFQKGRKGKYIEDPIQRNEAILGIKFVKNMDQEIGTKL